MAPPKLSQKQRQFKENFGNMLPALREALKDENTDKRQALEECARVLETPQNFESLQMCWEKFHKLGSFLLKDDSTLNKLDKAKLNVAMGIVDKKAFSYDREDIFPDPENLPGLNSYKFMQKYAVEMVEFWPYLQIGFPSLQDGEKLAKIAELTKAISETDAYTNEAWYSMFEEMGYTDKSDIDEYITGSEGVYQLIHAYQRAAQNIDKSELTAENLQVQAGSNSPLLVVSLEIEDDTRASRFFQAQLSNTENLALGMSIPEAGQSLIPPNIPGGPPSQSTAPQPRNFPEKSPGKAYEYKFDNPSNPKQLTIEGHPTPYKINARQVKFKIYKDRGDTYIGITDKKDPQNMSFIEFKEDSGAFYHAGLLHGFSVYLDDSGTINIFPGPPVASAQPAKPAPQPAAKPATAATAKPAAAPPAQPATPPEQPAANPEEINYNIDLGKNYATAEQAMNGLISIIKESLNLKILGNFVSKEDCEKALKELPKVVKVLTGLKEEHKQFIRENWVDIWILGVSLVSQPGYNSMIGINYNDGEAAIARGIEDSMPRLVLYRKLINTSRSLEKENGVKLELMSSHEATYEQLQQYEKAMPAIQKVVRNLSESFKAHAKKHQITIKVSHRFEPGAFLAHRALAIGLDGLTEATMHAGIKKALPALDSEGMRQRNEFLGDPFKEGYTPTPDPEAPDAEPTGHGEPIDEEDDGPAEPEPPLAPSTTTSNIDYNIILSEDAKEARKTIEVLLENIAEAADLHWVGLWSDEYNYQELLAELPKIESALSTLKPELKEKIKSNKAELMMSSDGGGFVQTTSGIGCININYNQDSETIQKDIEDALPALILDRELDIITDDLSRELGVGVFVYANLREHDVLQKAEERMPEIKAILRKLSPAAREYFKTHSIKIAIGHRSNGFYEYTEGHYSLSLGIYDEDLKGHIEDSFKNPLVEKLSQSAFEGEVFSSTEEAAPAPVTVEIPEETFKAGYKELTINLPSGDKKIYQVHNNTSEEIGLSQKDEGDKIGVYFELHTIYDGVPSKIIIGYITIDKTTGSPDLRTTIYKIPKSGEYKASLTDSGQIHINKTKDASKETASAPSASEDPTEEIFIEEVEGSDAAALDHNIDKIKKHFNINFEFHKGGDPNKFHTAMVEGGLNKLIESFKTINEEELKALRKVDKVTFFNGELTPHLKEGFYFDENGKTNIAIDVQAFGPNISTSAHLMLSIREFSEYHDNMAFIRNQGAKYCKGIGVWGNRKNEHNYKKLRKEFEENVIPAFEMLSDEEKSYLRKIFVILSHDEEAAFLFSNEGNPRIEIDPTEDAEDIKEELVENIKEYHSWQAARDALDGISQKHGVQLRVWDNQKYHWPTVFQAHKKIDQAISELDEEKKEILKETMVVINPPFNLSTGHDSLFLEEGATKSTKGNFRVAIDIEEDVDDIKADLIEGAEEFTAQKNKKKD